jgi:hypothetical protein
MMANAGHSCYDEPGRAEEFHGYVISFLKKLRQAISSSNNPL